MRKITLFILCTVAATTAFLSCSGGDEGLPSIDTVPTLSTPAISEITGLSAVGTASVTSTGGSTVTVRGLCWSVAPIPKITDNKTTEAGGAGSFSSTMTNLTPNTFYFVRAYATNSEGTAYGPQTSFTTGDAPVGLPVVSTSAVSAVTGNSATGGGNVIADGGSPITERGICWATTESPTTDNNTAEAEGTTGAFTANMTGLAGSTTYYVRAYAINANGTSYGSQVSFITAPSTTTGPEGGNAVCDGSKPTTVVTITSSTGKVWMDRNLGASRAATSATDFEAYGCLYQWGRGNDGHASITWVMGQDDDWGNQAGTAVNGTTSTLSSTDNPGHALFIKDETSIPYDWRSPKNDNLWQGVNGINNPCPSGFRVPTQAEFQAEIEAYSINGSAAAYSSIHKFPLAGDRAFDSGSVRGQGESMYFWTSTVDWDDAFNVLIMQAEVYTNTGNGRAGGYSVRCIKN